MDRAEQHEFAEEEVLAAFQAAVDDPKVRLAALVNSEPQQFAELFDSLFAERLAVDAPKTRAGGQWNSFHHLSLLEYAARRAKEGLSPAASPLAVLLGQALGEVPRVHTVRELHRRYGNPRLTKDHNGSEILGAYVLSAGMRRPTGGSLAEICLLLGMREVLARSFADQLTSLAGLLSVLRADLLLAIQRLLAPSAYEYDHNVPPVACSPCGVIRMASPQVPRGPDLALNLDTPSPSWALAA
ncbi:hypothetical protein [Streptomyces sp. NPDC088762]|uniref:hypothetical protein n=1 Tax=Streptomyces sp. NPDC088762 TaxID=3365891 RepID=UPI0037F626A4